MAGVCRGGGGGAGGDAAVLHWYAGGGRAVGAVWRVGEGGGFATGRPFGGAVASRGLYVGGGFVLDSAAVGGFDEALLSRPKGWCSRSDVEAQG